MNRRLLVTAALPYVNGHIHIGHLVEYIQTDIWVRFQRLRGHQAAYICADDTHGTATMIRARQEGRSEQDIIHDMSTAHQTDFSGFDVAFDHYGSTDSPANKVIVYEIWAALRAANCVVERDVTTPLTVTTGTKIASPPPIIVPILRAGLGMLDGMTRLLPSAEVGFLGAPHIDWPF